MSIGLVPRLEGTRVEHQVQQLLGGPRGASCRAVVRPRATSGHGRAASSWALRLSRVVSSSVRPTSWTPPPAGRRPRSRTGPRRPGCRRRSRSRRTRSPASRAATTRRCRAVEDADPRRAVRDRRGEQDVDLVEDPVGLRRTVSVWPSAHSTTFGRHPGAEPVGLPGTPLEPVEVLDLVGLGADAGEELRHERRRRVGVVRVDLAYVVAEVAQQPGRVLDRARRGSGRAARRGVTGLVDQPIRSRPGSRRAASTNEPVSPAV